MSDRSLRLLRLWTKGGHVVDLKVETERQEVNYHEILSMGYGVETTDTDRSATIDGELASPYGTVSVLLGRVEAYAFLEDDL